MGEKISISVIVAIYQAEQYLNRCVDSIINQSFTDIEILLIDDGSTDRSGDICDEYAKKDSRVKVFHKRNEGLSATRQFGMEHCCGEYTIHCDPDDWMESNMLELMYSTATMKNADIVMCDVWREYNDYKSLSKQNVANLDSKSLLGVIFDPLSASVCNKLIRLSCYRSFNVYFAKDIQYAEDLFVMLQFLTHSLRVEYLGVPLYHYDLVSNDSSITKSVTVGKMVQSISYMEKHLDESAAIALNKFKRDALILSYRTNPVLYKVYADYYHEIDRDLLRSGLAHPLRFWPHLVLGLKRYHLGWIGDAYAATIKFLLPVYHKIA